MYKFGFVSLSEIEEFRKMKLDDYRSQVSDYIEEGIVTYNAQCILIYCEDRKIGYFCVGKEKEFDNKILEFYLLNTYRKDAVHIISEALRIYGWDGWFVNSQDSFSLPLMIELGYNYRISGLLFSYESNGNTQEYLNEYKFTAAKITEVNEIYDLIMQDGFYTGGSSDTLVDRINEIYLLKKENKILGAGFLSILQRTPQYADLAMIIAPDERQKGYGELIQRKLIDECFTKQLIPTAACDVDNIISRKTLQNAGYYLDGCLLLADVK